MYVDVKKIVARPNGTRVPYADIYADSIEEASQISSTKYFMGSRLHIITTGDTYIANASGWYDVDGCFLETP